jgi:serine/threonine-protein kinase
MGERKYCYNCMEKYDSDLHVCPKCGYDEQAPHNPMYITPGTILRDRYLIGVLREFNGEGATYEGYDISTECRVLIREYMPINLCTRVSGKATISVNYNNLAKYKAFMAEYTELNKSLARLRNDSNINPVLDMFAENNTTYTVFEHINGVKMLDYLKDNAGELSWEQVSKLFPPLFTTIGRLHNAGIIHRAISPDTVYITDKGELRLSGFCVSAVRTANAGLEYELFKGYAAPEQYSASSSSRQGSWTDVYGVCALIYRALTGCMPVDSTSRIQHDDLCEPYMLNTRVPQHVSRVIMEGMNLSGRDRIQTITELVTKLFEQPVQERVATVPQRNEVPQSDSYNGYRGAPVNQYQQPVQQPVYNQAPPAYDYAAPPQRGYYEEEDYRYEKVNTVDRIKVPIIIAILLMAILMIIVVVIYSILHDPARDDADSRANNTSVSDNVVSGTTEDTTGAADTASDTEVPSFTKKFYDHEKEKWKDFFELEAVYEYNNDFDHDMIFEQDVEAGTMVAKGTTIKVKVSKGPETAIIPDYTGLTAAQYKTRLQQAGISEFNYQFTKSELKYGTPDSVIELQVDGKRVAAGTKFDNKEGKKLIVYYLGSDTQQQTQPPEQPTDVPEPTDIPEPTDAPEPTNTPEPTTTPVEQPTEIPQVTDAPEVTEASSEEYGVW